MCAGATPAPVLAAAQPAAEPSVHAQRVTESIRVDGRLDEPAWAKAPVASGFRQREPREGEPATEPTEVSVLYDDRTLYVGSDLYVFFNDEQGEEDAPGRLIGLGFAVKGSWLIRF